MACEACCVNLGSPFHSARVTSCRAFASSTPVPELVQPALAKACDEIADLEAKMEAVEQQLLTIGRTMPDVVLLQTVPGVGLLTATALVALVSDIRRFRSGRHFASFLGLTPKEDSTGHRRRLGAISKQGDVYLRMLLVHGARTVLWHAKTKAQPTALQRFAIQTAARRGPNVAAVAVANKLARIVWAVWAEQRPYEREPRLAAR
jgi:transposase